MPAAIEERIESSVSVPACLWHENSNRLVSLWEIMQLFSAEACCSIFSFFGRFEQHCVDLGGLMKQVPDYLALEALNVVLQTEEFCRQNTLVESRECAVRLRDQWWRGYLAQKDPPQIDFDGLRVTLKHLRELMESEMRKQLFFGMTSDLSKYYNKERPMGDDIYKAFPRSQFDIAEAGTCLACSCNVASAFHLMRATEVGLWELGRDRQIPLAQSGKIEFTEWGHIIRELEDSVKAIQQWSASAKKEEAHKFYNSALAEVRSFNDGWRRHAAHNRPHSVMHNDEALALWGHVFRFLTTLATKIQDGKYTPLVW